MENSRKYDFDHVFSFGIENNQEDGKTVLTKQMYLKDEVEILLAEKEHESFTRGKQEALEALEKTQETQLTILTEQLLQKANEFDTQFQHHYNTITSQAIALASSIALKISCTSMAQNAEQCIVDCVKEKLPTLKKYAQLDVQVPDNLVDTINSIKDAICAETRFSGQLHISGFSDTTATLPQCSISWQNGAINFDINAINREIEESIDRYITQIATPQTQETVEKQK